MYIYAYKCEQVSTYHPEGPRASPWPIIQIHFFDPAPAKEQDFGDVDFESEIEWGKTTKEELLLAKARALVSLFSLSLCARVCNICTGGREGKEGGVNKLLANARAVFCLCIKSCCVVLCMHYSSPRPTLRLCLCHASMRLCLCHASMRHAMYGREGDRDGGREGRRGRRDAGRGRGWAGGRQRGNQGLRQRGRERGKQGGRLCKRKQRKKERGESKGVRERESEGVRG